MEHGTASVSVPIRESNDDSPRRPCARSLAAGRDLLPFLGSGVLGLLWVLGVTLPVAARDMAPLVWMPAPTPGMPSDDLPGAGLPIQERAVGDTLSFGYVDGDGFAILGETWSFDHGGADPLEGWTEFDVTEQIDVYGRQITDAIWNADPGNGVDAPILSGAGSAFIGAFVGQADALCWEGGLGYGNNWCQRLISPVLSRGDSSSVELTWLHFNHTEPEFDYVEVYVELLPGGERVDLREYMGEIGLAPNHPVDPPVGAADGLVLSPADFGDATDFRLVFEMTSDGAFSDADGNYPTEYGPLGLDDVLLTESPGGALLGSYGFEMDLDGWIAEACPGFGPTLGVASVGDYLIEDACDCDLAGNVLEFHDENQEHPYGQHSYGISPSVDVLNDVTPFLPGTGQMAIMAEWDQYSVMPRANGVLYRPGWLSYPYTCEVTGEIGWSDRIGQRSFYFVGEDPLCAFNRNIGTDVDGVPVPVDTELVRFVFEVYASCDAFGIHPLDCTGETNATPLIDNVRIAFTEVARAPNIAVELGLNFGDGFAQNTWINDPRMPGRADATRNINFGNTAPYVMGDSMQIAGPVVTTSETSWESRLWFRMTRVGPGADARYTTWRDRVADGFAIDPELAGEGNPIEFAYGLMDSAQLGTNAFKNKFVSYFREDDDDFDPGEPENSDGNEILADDVLFPGTQVEYFLSAYYVETPDQVFLLPDTSGGYFRELEILPSWRDVEGVWKYPCFLYIDADNRGSQAIIEPALDIAGIAHDRFDYLDACT